MRPVSARSRRVLALGRPVDHLVGEPAVVVADELVPRRDVGLHDGGVPLRRAGDGEQADLRIEAAEHLEQPPCADA